MQVIFDIGMYDAADTVYYLEAGYKVIAIEANPNLIRRATVKLRRHIDSGQLKLINAAIGPEGQSATLIVSGDDLGSSSIFEMKVADRNPVDSYSVPRLSIQELIHQHGIPHYMKIDIEGADRYCVLGLTRETRPIFLSFEIGEDVEELLNHCLEIGYKQFKIINQRNFLEINNFRRWYDRIACRLIRLMGYQQPLKIRRCQRFFIAGSSSGPPPWSSNGRWYTAGTAIAKWRRAKQSGKPLGWFDIHAC